LIYVAVTQQLAASSNIWQIEIHNAPDNRLTRTVVVDGLLPALDTVEHEWRSSARSATKENATGKGGALIIVGLRGQDKFFSNGMVPFMRTVYDATVL
jgi:Delta3-Delta2-enoyl-CoA isomerase